jgi:acyl-CoA reductase-like NAD-dependent aldehyde dehydrogenase
MDDEVGAAKSAFPEEASKIDRLAVRNEDFADLCRDFDLAVSEHRSWAASQAPERSERLSEYAMLVEELKGEIERALVTADVVRLKPDASRRR